MKAMQKSELYISTIGVLLIINQLFVLGFAIAGNPINVGGILSIIVGILGGLVAIVYFREKKMIGVAFCLFLIGLTIILADIERAFSTDESDNFVASLLYVVTGVVLVYHSASLAVGLKTGSAKSIVCLAVISILELYLFLSVVRRGDDLTAFDWTNLIMAIEHGAFIVILTRPEMMISPFLKRLRTNSDVLYDAMVSDPEVYVDRKDVGRLTDISDGPEWTHLDNGPIERETTVGLHSRWTATEMLLQKWKDDDRLHLTVRNKGTDSYNIVMSMVVDQTVLSKNDDGKVTKIRFYGQEGVFADVIVVSDDELTKGYIDIIKSKMAAAKAKKQS